MSERLRAAKEICRVLGGAGYRALFAGGCVRDTLLGVEPKDYDIATNATPDEIAGLFRKCLGIGAAFGVQIVVLPEGQFEVATFRKDGTYSDGRRPDEVQFTDEIEDARRRDFTVNALFLEPESGRILDYVGGQEDIRAGVLRTVGEPSARFSEDHLRLLRAVRFAARLGYEIEPVTAAAMQAMAELSVSPSAERVSAEVTKCLTEGGARRAIELMERSGMLRYVLPEVERMKGIEQPPEFHPEGDVYMHTLLMLEQLPSGVSPTLAFATLLHDAGKPLTQTWEDRIRFNLHDKVGAREAEQACRRFRLSNEDTERIAWLVENHMRLEAAPGMRPSRLKRFLRHEAFAELLQLCRLDCLASHKMLTTVDWVAKYLEELPPEELKPEPFLRGTDLIEMGYVPGPLFKEILRTVEDAQLDGTIDSAEAAFRLVRERWPRQA